MKMESSNKNPIYYKIVIYLASAGPRDHERE